jgi:hypothetical protein
LSLSSFKLCGKESETLEVSLPESKLIPEAGVETP